MIEVSKKHLEDKKSPTSASLQRKKRDTEMGSMFNDLLCPAIILAGTGAIILHYTVYGTEPGAPAGDSFSIAV